MDGSSRDSPRSVNMRSILLGLAIYASLVLGRPSRRESDYEVKESVSPPREWNTHGVAPSHHKIELSIGLPQPNFDVLVDHLYQVSDPSHSRYGQHLTKEEVEALVAPHPESLDLVNAWLSSHGIEEKEMSPANDWITIRIPVRLAEKLLDTTYHVWTHASTGESIVRTTSYSLPAHLHEHVDVIQPTTMFARMKSFKSTIHRFDKGAGQIVEESNTPIISASGVSVDPSCNSTITISCLKQLYNAVGVTPSTKVNNSIGITGYLEQFANFEDLQSFYALQLPEALNTSFKVVPVAGGLNNQTLSEAGDEADLDGTFYTTAGSPPFIPDLETPTDTNEPYISSPRASRYGRARGVSLTSSSGDGGVGDGDSDPATQTCITNDGKNKTEFLPLFPASCPFVTGVGGTINVPEIAVFFSGAYQDAAVKSFLNKFPKGKYAGLFNPNGRGIPDVAAEADRFQVVVGGETGLIGGTSAASPTFAGFVALLNDARFKKGKPSLGFLNPLFYSSAVSGFNDITEGNNPGCGTEGFNATVGWDPTIRQITGLIEDVMSFTFNWPQFSDQFHYDAIQMLNNALNKGNKPPVIADKIEVVELQMGTKVSRTVGIARSGIVETFDIQPPDLEIREIGELTVDQFRGIFRLSYEGDALIVLKTKVQANPLNHKQPDIHLMSGSKGMLAARQPLVVPMHLRLSNFKLRSIVVLVVSKQKGITLVFKTDPLQNVDINSTFDSVAVIQNFIQREIEGQLRQMFREDLPGIIHQLSQQWIKAKVEAPYLAKRTPAPPAPPAPSPSLSLRSEPHAIRAPLSFDNVAGLSSAPIPPYLHSSRSFATGSTSLPHPRSAYSGITGTTRRSTTLSKTTPSSPPDDTSSTFPDLENFDPTYGLRPEGLPNRSVFKGFQNLFTPNRGLADLSEESSELNDNEPLYDHDDSTTYDMVDWDSGVPGFAVPTSVDQNVEYETIPAVGGGSIVRPRVVHSQSMIQESQGPLPSSKRLSLRPTDPLFTPLHAGVVLGPSSARLSGYNPYFSDSATRLASFTSPLSASPLSGSVSGRPVTPDSMETQPSYSSGDNTHSILTPREGEPVPIPISAHSSRSRRPSISSNAGNFQSSSSPNYGALYDMEDGTPKIILRPTPFNNTLHQLSTLSHSNHTLSPYTRSLEHFTVRSVPPRYIRGNSASSSADRQPIKAKRKRTYRLGGQKGKTVSNLPLQASTDHPHRPSSPDAPDSELDIDVSDMDRYFRAHSDADQKNYGALAPSGQTTQLPGGVEPFSPPNIHPHHFRLRSSYVYPE
ncbi:hypothetical protein D9757_001210 [Collybiopsis confluens]|uniref:Mitochondrial distribution and morphology protein 34 n=1 Tax=Collybiopsis confluens TaxID=2823264 RepID=A0A8H5MGF0_9AGAR|nr:hypothetical protein D9757_001210 [Collybiopsis confluens]